MTTDDFILSDTSGVKDMGQMFYGAELFNMAVPFGTSQVTTMENMF